MDVKELKQGLCNMRSHKIHHNLYHLKSHMRIHTGNIKNKITNYGLRPQAGSRIRVRTQILDPEGNSGNDFCKLQFSLKTNVQLLVTIILFIGFVQTFVTWEIHFVRRFFDFLNYASKIRKFVPKIISV